MPHSKNLIVQTSRSELFTTSNLKERFVDLNEIAWALFNIRRWNGHTNEPHITVGQHSLAVAEVILHYGRGWDISDKITTKLVLQALLHDAVEAFTGDIIAPVKPLMGRRIADVERALEGWIFHGLGAKLPIDPIVHNADALVGFAEARLLFDHNVAEEWSCDPGEPIMAVVKKAVSLTDANELRSAWIENVLRPDLCLTRGVLP